MLKNHLKKAIAAAMIFVMVFALTAPALAEENSELKAAEDAVREAEENYNIAVEQYNKLVDEMNNLPKTTDPDVKRTLEAEIRFMQSQIQSGTLSSNDKRDYEELIEYKRYYIKNYPTIIREEFKKKHKEEFDALREEMYRCELLLDLARYDLERLQQALIIPQTGDSNAVYLAAGVMLILAGAGLAVSRKRS